ncbi:MAG: ethylbenzene dehydrogenase-related protein [Gammaproteobacteria bacterium]|nr:ethylbenzene dehydrogenase-related protein [Gammaproteobacteria bacterium]
MKRSSWIFRIVCSTLGMLLIVALPVSAKEIDWEKVKAMPIDLFYPGQASWEWVLTKHKGAKSVRKGSPCLECHEGEEKAMGDLIVKGGYLEPNTIDNKPGTVKAIIKAVQDDHNLYVQVKWDALGFTSGKKVDQQFKAKVAVMLSSEEVKEVPVAGCWGFCHSDATGMAFSENKTRELYLSKSRIKLKRSGGGDDLISSNELNDLLIKNYFVEYWQAQLAANETKVVSGYILEKRHAHKSAVVDVSYSQQTGDNTLVFVRPLQTSLAPTKKLNQLKNFYMGFAIHDDYAEGRFHYVSFARRMSLDGSTADYKIKTID